MSNRPLRLRRLASIASLAAVGLGAACVPQMGEDISHVSRWTLATFSDAERNTNLEIAAGIDDPVAGGLVRQLEVRLTQSWCDGETLVQRSLEGSSNTFIGDVKATQRFANVAGTATLTGPETSTPAGPGCATPQAELATTEQVSVVADVTANLTGIGQRLSYTEEDGGEYLYQDADGTGSLFIDGEVDLDFASADVAGTWLWQGYWPDARGLDIEALIPAT